MMKNYLQFRIFFYFVKIFFAFFLLFFCFNPQNFHPKPIPVIHFQDDSHAKSIIFPTHYII